MNNTVTPYQRLKEIFETYPELTFQNDGYEYLPRATREKYADQMKEVSEILKETFGGFRKFNHFKLDKNGEPVIRLQYNYNHGTDGLPFTGVGYFKLDLWKEEEPITEEAP